MIWAGSPFAQRIEFSTGFPAGAVSYQLLDNDGSILVDQELTPEAGAISMLILISGAHNSCNKPLFEARTLTWNYTTDTGLVSDRITYRVQKPIPFPVSTDGVRAKLGIEPHELRDDEIDLVSAYSELVALVPDGSTAIYETAGDRNTIILIHAIEAVAALTYLPALQLKIAQRESGGTNEFSRFTKIDWDRIESDLIDHIARARALLDTEFDVTGDTVTTFSKATPSPDVITGA